MKKFLLCGYRTWALNALEDLVASMSNHSYDFAKTPEELSRMAKSTKYDAIIVVGWSWIIEKEIVDNNYVVGMHPSKLPDFAGGSPIQHQIIAGLTESYASLFRLTTSLDAGGVIDQAPFNLEGHLDEVLREILHVTVKLLINFIERYPNVSEVPQIVERTFKRFKPEHSKLSPPNSMTVKELWNFIRCREDPYPNAYLEDETGRLVIKRVEFEPK